MTKSDPVTLRIGVAIPKITDPSSGVTSFVGNQLNEQLIGIGWDGRPAPRLVSSWNASDDGLTLTLKLAGNLQFHDGTPIDADFVRSGITDYLKNSLLDYKGRKSVVSVDAQGTDQVVIRLSRPESLLLSELPNYLVSHPTNKELGVGPYRMLPGSPLRLARNDNYYRGRPQIEFLEVHEFNEQRSSWTALMRGDIDAVHEISPAAVPFIEIQGQTKVKTYPFTRPYFLSLIFNTKHPVLKSAKVRQALSYAVDRKALIEKAVSGQGIPADGPVWPFHWAYSAAARTYSQNLETATMGLESAGLRMSSARVAGAMRSRLRFRCITIARYERIALVLQKQLTQVGVDMDVQTLAMDDLVKRMMAGDFDAILMERTSGRSLAWTYAFFHSSAVSLGYKSADVPLEKMRTAMSDAETRAAVSDFQRILFDDPPAIFLIWPQVARVVSSGFVIPEEKGRDVISSLWQWKPVGPGQ